MTAGNWPNPEQPGVPMNPERDGWHWMQFPEFPDDPEILVAVHWCADFAIYEVGDDCIETALMQSKGAIYLGPSLTPAEHQAALDATWQAACEAMRERAAQYLNYHAARLRKQDEDERGVPSGMGHRLEAYAGDAWAHGIRALPTPERPR